MPIGTQEGKEEESGVRLLGSDTFRVDGVRVATGDHVFLLPDTFDQLPAATADDREAVPDYAAKSRHVKVTPLHHTCLHKSCACLVQHLRKGNLRPFREQ